MINYFKLPGHELYWQLEDETTTVIQVTNRTDGSKGITKTISVDRYNDLAAQTGSFESITSSSFESMKNDVLNYLG